MLSTIIVKGPFGQLVVP